MVNIGDKFGRFTVIELTIEYDHRQKRTYAICRCDCGSFPVRVRLDGLTKPPNSSRKPSRSCGCLHKEQVTKHGVWQHPLYKIWRAMMERCYDHNNKRYNRYGGRGIEVCYEWHSVHQFIEDMYADYRKGLQIDRIDNDKGYFKINCRWATRTEQANNKFTNHLVTFNDKTQTIKQWSRELQINYGTLINRINIFKWPIDKAFTQPVRKGNYRRKEKC